MSSPFGPSRSQRGLPRWAKALVAAVLLVIGFGGGLVVGLVIDAARFGLSVAEVQGADDAAALQQRIIEELQGHYYREVDVKKLGSASIDGMLESLDDPYTVYMDAQETQAMLEQNEGRYSGIGATLEMAEDGTLLIVGVFGGSPAKKAGLAPGDRILRVDGTPTKDRSLEGNIAHIKGEAGTQVKLLIEKAPAQGQSAGGRVELTLTRQEITIPISERRMLTASNGVKVGYVELAQFSEDAEEDVRANVEWAERRGARWILFDLRDNGGGLVSEAVDVASLFIREGSIVSTEGLHSPKEIFDATGDIATQLPLIVLVNEYTASASEITAGALQDYKRGTLIGTRTFGKGLVQNLISLPGGAALKLTTAVYLTPKGRDINDKGITPAVIVKDKPKEKGDEQLKAALDYVAKQ